MKLKFKLAHKISLLVVVLVVISVGASIYVAGQWNVNMMLQHIESNTLNVVKITALSPIVIDGLSNPEQSNKIQAFIEKTQAASDQIDVMVVADVNGIRYGHTKSDRLGKPFSAEDNYSAITKGETYVSIGPGTLGDSLRAFTPIKDSDGQILGFVMAGTLLDSLEKAKLDNFKIMMIFIGLGSLIGIGGALFVSYYIKKSLLNYEPEDIARLYLENQGILSTVHEGIIAVNENYEITLMNKKAYEYLNLDEQIIHHKIQDIFPLSRLPEAMEKQEIMLDLQYALNDHLVISNNIPIVSEQRVIGGVSSFRDQTQMSKLAEEMTGVKNIVESLRATTHEFKNKLHVILGFIETNSPEEAKRYIGAINEDMQDSISSILNAIEEPTIAALLIGKIQIGHELNIKVRLTDDCHFTNQWAFDVNSLVVILGNLVENALEHLNQCKQAEKFVEVYMNDEQDNLEIVVRDNGNGIKDVDEIFKKGFTSKSNSRGFGLFLVKENVDKYQGDIQVETELNYGSEFTIVLWKRGKI